MQNAGKNRKPLIIGIIAAVAILAVVLVLLLTQCTGGQTEAATAPSTTVATEEVPTYELYWNVDRALYDGKSEAGMSSRMPESDGYFHVRFILDGEEVTLKVADRKVINAIDVKSLMGLEFDENGIVVAAVAVEDMPLEKVAWQFYVQSAGGKTIKANSSSSMNGMEVLLEGDENTGVYHMSGLGGEMGSTVTPIGQDRIYAIQNLAGELTHVFVYERPNYMQTHEAECQHCKKVVTWYEYTNTERVPYTTGHYQLQNDIVSTVGQTSLAEDVEICLDLNGKRVDGKSGARVYSMHNVGVELAIMDTSPEQNGTIAAHGKADAGMCVWVRYGEFYLYGGILDGSDATTAKNGTTVTLQSNTYMYMYGGEIIGGTATYTYNAETKKYGNGLGGAMVLSNKSKFVMYDGVIRDGYAEGVITARNKDGSPKTYQRGLGGNIFMSGGSLMELHGGVIKNGKAFTTAGNIYMDGASELIITGGSIQGGRSMGKGKNGGSLFVSTKAKVTMSRGSITGGISRNCGGNVYVNGLFTMTGGYISGGKIVDWTSGKVNPDAASRNVFVVNGNFQMSGGKIWGGMQLTDSSATDGKRTILGLSNGSIIDGGEESKTNLTLSVGAGGPVDVMLGKFNDGALYRVSTTSGIFTRPTVESSADHFVSDIEGADIHYYQECVALGRLYCICGKEEHFGACDGTEYLWAPHTSATTLPNGDGFYYLQNDVTLSGTTYLQGDVSKHTRVDLNGKSVLGPTGKGRTYSLFENTKTYDENGKIIPNIEGVEMKLTVTDTVGTGVITMREHNDLDQGSMFWGRHVDSEINIYGGTFDGSAATSTRHNGVLLSAAGDLNIYGGTFIGGTSSNGGTIAVAGADSIFTMTGGTIMGGTAVNGGGNVVLSKAGATFDFKGGTIEGGKAMNGGNIYMAAGTVMNMSGGTVTGGVVDNSAIEMDGGLGGNIYQNGTFTMTGGVIEKGYVRGGTKGGGHGGNLGVYGTVSLEGGVIRDGEARSAGGNVASIATNAVLVLNGVRLENGKAGMGGNLAVHVRHCKEVSIFGGTVITGGTATNYGGNISVRVATGNAQTMTMSISDATVENGTATNYGGNIFLYNTGKAELETNLFTENAVITGGKAGTQGGNIHAESNVYVQTNTTEISDGTAKQGGNIFSYKATSVLVDSVITGGTAVKEGDGANGGNVYINAGAMDLVGSELKDGVAIGNTAGKYPTGGNLYITGGANVYVNQDSVISGGQTQQNVAYWTAGGNVYLHNGTLGTDGIITGGAVNSSGSKQGHNIYICKNGTVNVYDGKIENTIKAAQSIYFEGGTFNLVGGEVVNVDVYSRNFSSKADVGGEINIMGGKVSGGFYESGGNFYLPSSFTLNISGGTIEGGTAELLGGNISAAKGSTVNMTGGTISGGKNTTASNNGGSIYIYNGATFNLSGGTVKDGSTMNIGGNFYNAGTLNISGDAYITGGTKNGAASTSGNIANVNGTLNISGGVIDGDMGATNSGKNGVVINLSNKVVINKGKVGGLLLSRYNYDLPAHITLDGTLEEGSHIVIDSVADTVITSNATVEENLQFFEALKPEKDLVWVTLDKDIDGDGESDLHKLSFGLNYCICGVDSDDPADHLGDCGGELLTWLPWTKTDSLPTTEGNWYLTGNVTLTSERSINTDGTINIDLNGKTVKTEKNMRVIRVYHKDIATTTHVGITDTSAEKTGKIVHTSGASTLDGAIVWITRDTHSFSLYGGTLDASGVTSGTHATALKVNRGVANIYGGAIIGGTTTDSAQNGVAIRVNSPATLNISGGTLTGGTGGNHGGIIGSYGTLNISGGTFIPGDVKHGDCIVIIKDAETTTAKLTITDCELPGDIYLNNYAGGCDVTLNGKVIINKGSQYGLNVTGTDKGMLKVSGLTEGSSISLIASGYFAEGANETIATYFKPELDGQVILEGDKLFLGKRGCLCGNIGGKCIDTVCDGTELLWRPWTSTTSVPTASGNWYLTKDVKPTGSIAAVNDANVVLDLNGHTVTRGGRLITMRNITNTSYTITDTSAAQTGKVVFSGTASDQGGIWVNGTNNKLTLVRGTLDGSGRTLTGNAGIVIAVTSGGTFEMHGGTVLGGACKAAEGRTSYGGAIASSGKTTIYGGTVSGGSSSQDGGNIHISGGTFTVNGGTITGGSALNGGNINISAGKLIVNGGTISGGKASAHGGNIHQAGGTVELLGGTVENGSVTSSVSDSGGGNLAANAPAGKLTLNGVTLSKGSASQRGGNIYLYGEGIDMSVTGDTLITGGVANYGANIYLDAASRAEGNAVATMNGGKITAGAARANAGSVYISDKYEFVLNDGVIENGTGKGDGGNIYIRDAGAAAGLFTMNGGSLTGGEAGKDNTAGRNGGNVYVAANGSFVLNGGTVSGGKSNNSGGNVHVIGTMKVTGGTVKGGSAKNESSWNISVQGGSLEMSGGKVEGNVTIVNSNASHDSKIILSGEPVIAGGTLGLKLTKVSPATKAPVISVKGSLGAKANIVISREVSDSVIGDTTAGSNAAAFSAQNTAKDVVKLDDGTLYLGKYGCICGGVSGTDCAKAGHPKVKWTAWTSTTSTPGSGTSGTAGNYYLTGDISVSGSQNYPNAIEVNIDLNGYNITGSGDRLFRMRNNSDPTTDYALTIGIKNSRNGNGKGIISSTNTAAQEGFLVWMVQPSQVFNLYAGTLDGSKATTVASKSGGCVMLNKGTFNMYGGEIKDGTATANGGNVSLNASTTFNLFGGTVSGGEAASSGGNFYVNGTLNIKGGTVSGGEAKTGGSIGIGGTGKVVLSGKGMVTGGAASSSGGNIYVAKGGTFQMLDGTVTDGNAAGSAVKDHENIHCKYGTLDLRGGSIDGYVMAQNWNTEASTTKLSGDIQITGGTKNLVLSWGTDNSSPANYPVIELGQLKEGAKIGITSGGTLIAKGSSAVLTDAKQYLSSDAASKQIVQTAEGLAFANASKLMGCICGGKSVGVGDHKCVDVEWTETNTIPTATGNYILTANVVSDKQYDPSGQTINIDLNGHEITVKSGVSSGRVYRLVGGTVMNITDSSEAGTGQIIGHGGNDSNPQGGVFVMSAGAKLNLYAGTITSTATNNSKSGGGVIYTTGAGTTFTMYGGRVTGGKTTAAGGNLWINSDSTFVMYDGKIDGGTSSNTKHSNIHIKFAHAEVYGGEITGGFFVQNYNTSTSTIKIAGNPVIYGEGAAYNLVLGWSKAADNTAAANYPVIELGELTEGANIYVSDVAVGRVIAEPAGSYEITATDAGYITSHKADTKVVLEEGNLVIAAK